MPSLTLFIYNNIIFNGRGDGEYASSIISLDK